MACVLIKNTLTKEEVWHDEGKPYSMPWSFTGQIKWDCGPMPSPDSAGPTVDEELAKEGLKLGDAIAWATSKLGIKQCAPCHARQEILNHVKELGWKETIRQLKETLKHE